MSTISYSELGWKPFFQQQLSFEESQFCFSARVMAQHRDRIQIHGPEGTQMLAITSSMTELVTGDWLIMEPGGVFKRCLERQSVFYRKGAGTRLRRQLIGANIDYVFVLMALNGDFNLNRLERYLAMIAESGAIPVVILSRADECAEPEAYVSRVQALDSSLSVIALDCRSNGVNDLLATWCRRGDTIAMLGSSGVGKSTLVNTLIGLSVQQTGGIREQDSKGKHITSGRKIQMTQQGVLLMDLPGMRELQLTDCEQGLELAFHDVRELESGCRFNDCSHQQEPGCAIRKALEQGKLDSRRWQNYLSLVVEEKRNSESLAEKKSREKQFSKTIRTVQEVARLNKQSE